MDMQAVGSLAKVAMASKEGFQRFNELGVLVVIMGDQAAKCLAEEARLFWAGSQGGQKLVET